MLMKQGLDGLFTYEEKFESEARFGRQIYYTAWFVEILAACIGLIIAWVTAYDAWNSEPVKTTSHLLNSILGALPFLVIAVIEPTKIPLAGGLYKTRILGWKILILVTLLGLTAVTFETMFNGLERINFGNQKGCRLETRSVTSLIKHLKRPGNITKSTAFQKRALLQHCRMSCNIKGQFRSRGSRSS